MVELINESCFLLFFLFKLILHGLKFDLLPMVLVPSGELCLILIFVVLKLSLDFVSFSL